ncbi:ChiQ/YbfN family lipoprotein, partial [Escherichia sp. TWPC-MK]
AYTFLVGKLLMLFLFLQQFADQESVRVLDYQQCLRATQTGNDQAVKADCDKVWQEIRSNNK